MIRIQGRLDKRGSFNDKYDPKDNLQQRFDRLARDGMAEWWARDHKISVTRFLEKADLKKPFTFLDVGCGNGWVVRAMADRDNCKAAMGIDISKSMIKIAKQKTASAKVSYKATSVEKLKLDKKFDRIFSMEMMYIIESPQKALENIFRLLNPGGMFFCGMDFYAENHGTSNWSTKYNIKLHMMSKMQWKRLFETVGFSAKTTQVRIATDRLKWKRESGTLFVTGTKPQRRGIS